MIPPGFPLSKTLHPDDLIVLADYLSTVDRDFTRASPQHELRRWEYALALAAFDQWWAEKPLPSAFPILDVGGSGSPFASMVDGFVHIIDPKETHRMDLQAYLRTAPRLSAAVFCLSVIEHVKDLDQFLYHLACLVAPGGLLVITTDCWNGEGEDAAHFHWMRERIFTPASLYKFSSAVEGTLRAFGFDLFGGLDPTYHGDQLYGSYSFGSLVMRKRP